MSAITYLLQVSGCMAIFYLFYYLLLNRLTFFTINRYYLVVTLVLSFVIPALTIPVHDYTPVVQHTVQVNSFKNLSAAVYIPKTTTVAATPEINWLLLLKVGYLLVAAGLFVRLIIMLAGFFARLKNKQVKKVGNINIVHGNKQLTNGSFLNYIFLDDAELSPTEIQQIIAHEMLHVKLMHSVDRILVKIIQIILWFNPFAYLYARSIEENHEFEVDREIALSTDKTEYADLLLHLSVATQGMIYNNFSTVPLKKRIIMLFNQPSAKIKRMVYILVVPVLIVSCMAFATFKQDKDGTLKVAYKPHNPFKQIIGTAYLKTITNKLIATDTTPANVPGAVGAINEKPLANNVAPALQTIQDAAPQIPAADTIKPQSVLRDVEKLGPNPLVIIDGKEYPKDILYNISRRCLRYSTVLAPDEAVKKYGAKASDGYVNITTANGEIIYLTATQKENLIIQNAIPETQLYRRIELKGANGELFDEVGIHSARGGGATTQISHNGKVAFFIDKVFYTEEQMKNITPQQHALMTGMYGVKDLSQKSYPKLDLHGYEAIFYFESTVHLPLTANDIYPYEQHLPQNN